MIQILTKQGHKPEDIASQIGIPVSDILDFLKNK